MDITKQILNLLNLQMSRLENIWATGIIVDDSYGEYLKCHHLLEVSLGSLLLGGFLKLGDAVVILIC